MSDAQYADPAVSRKKFNREIAQFRSQADVYGRRGWYLVEAKFPHALLILATTKTQPLVILCGVSFDYSNYDAAPPSVRLVHPLTREPYKQSELPTHLLRRMPQADSESATPGELSVQPLIQAHEPGGVPFVCIAGVREYHDHPAHSGDHWELYRSSGAGRLVRLVGIISKYGPETIIGLQIVHQIQFQMGIPAE